MASYRTVILFLLLIPSMALGTVYSNEEVDGDGAYVQILNGLSSSTKNFGSCVEIPIQSRVLTDSNYYSIGVFNFNSITTQGSGVIVACTLFVRINDVIAAGNVTSHTQMKPYFVGTSCNAAENGASSWNEWYQHSTSTLDTLFTTRSTPPASWGSEGSTWNRSDATGHDRTAAMSTLNVTATGDLGWAVDTTFANQFMRGNIPQFTILLIPAATVRITATAVDEIDTGPYTPNLHIWWGDAAAAPSRGTGRFGKSTTGAYLNDR